MKYLLTLAAILSTFVGYGQGIYNKQATNIKQNRMAVDSVLIVPRDTTATNLATYLGSQIGDSARMAWLNGRFWGHTATGWRGFGYSDEVPPGSQDSISAQNLQRVTNKGNTTTLPIGIARATNVNQAITLGQLIDSLATKAAFYLTGLATYPDSVLQPTDTYLRAFEKIQGQFNGIVGRYIENQDAVYQLGKFTLSGASKIRSTTQRANLTLVKGPLDSTYAILAFEDYAGNRLGYIGAPSFTDPNSTTWISQLSRSYIITRDTASVIFGNFTGSNSQFYTYMRNGHWRFYRAASNPFDHDHTNYSDAYTMQVDGQLRFDTLRALNFTSATTAVTGTTGKYLGVDANGDVKQYDLRADQSWLNGRSMLYTISSDTLQNISQSTNYHWSYVRRSTGAVLTTALFVNGSTGKFGVNTASPSSILTVKGSISSTHTVTAGNLTLSDVHSVVRISNAAHAITLPAASGAYSGTEGRIYTVINYTASPATISSVQVYGVGTTAIPANTSWTVQSDGTNWILISRSN